jgi:predicted CoA-binding protein/protein-tyrosine-phosphatase
MLAARGRSDVVVRSGGIAPWARDSSLVSLDARLVLRDEGVELAEDATACDLKRNRHHLREADLIVTMTEEQRRMVAGFPEAAGKSVRTLRELAGESGDIDDPAGCGEEVYRACGDEIRRCLEKAVAILLPAAGGASGAGTFPNPSDEELRTLLARSLTIAVVGCSPDPGRDSHRVARLLRERGHRVVPVNPSARAILGERCYASLAEIDRPIDMVDVFRRPEAVPAIVEETIAIAAPVLWLQLGVVHPTAAARARAAGVTVIMDRCPAIEYRRLFPAGDARP